MGAEREVSVNISWRSYKITHTPTDFRSLITPINKSAGPVQGVAGKDLVDGFPKNVSFGMESYLVRSRRA